MNLETIKERALTVPITITVAGDFCPIGRIEAQLLSNVPPSSNAFRGVRELADTSDLFIVNLECPLTRSKHPIQKTGKCLMGRPDSVSLLRTLGVGLATLANNHIGDFGEAGIADTIAAISKNGIATVGAGESFDFARRIHYQEFGGRTLAVINMAEQEFGCSETGRGGANPFDVIAAVEDIRAARAQADHVLLILHGGLEHVHFPSPDSVRVLRFLAEQGPTAIVRHHAHRVQGHEVWKGVPIVYGLGNFLFDWFSRIEDPAWYQGVLAELVIDSDDSCKVVIHPFEQHPSEPGIELLGDERGRGFFKQYNEWCRLISDEAAARQAWDEVIKQRAEGYFSLLSVPHPFVARFLGKARLLRFVKPARWKRRFLENILRCDAHRELLLDILKRT